jgi:uncharacterized membrane protein YhhN
MWLFLYILLSALDIVGNINSNEILICCTKPLLMPVLLVWFLKHTRFEKSFFKRAMIIALVAAFLGDVFLLFESQNEIFFLFGLGSFLIGQVAYAISFLKSIKDSEGKGDKKLYFLFALIFASFYFLLMHELWSNLADFTIPVVIYGLAICFMGLTAAYRYNKVVWHSYWYILGGALTFVVSDCIIAINKFIFGGDLFQAQALIMFTYCLAQYLIIRGAIIYIKSVSK